jgi:hypothetical protein
MRGNQYAIGLLGSRAWTPQSLTVENSDPAKVILTLKIADTTSVATDFGIIGKVISSLSKDGTNKILTFTLSSAIIYGDVLSLIYKGKSYLITNNVSADTDAVAYFARMAVQPSLGIKRSLNKWFVGIKADGVYTELDSYCLYFLHTEQASLLSIKGDTLNHSTVGNPIWTAYQGYEIINNSYIRSHFIPSVNGSKFALNNAGVILDVTKAAGDNVYDEGVSDTISAITIGYGTVLGQYNQMNSLNAFAVYNWPSGFNISARTSSSQVLSANNGTENTYAKNSVALPTKEYFIGAFNNNGSAANFNIGNKYKDYGFGSAMDNTKRNALRTRTVLLYNEIVVQGAVDVAMAADSGLVEKFDNVLSNSLVLYNSDGFDKKIVAGKFEFNTTNQNIIIKTQPTIYSAYPQWAQISIFENDVFKEVISITDSQPRVATLSAGSKKVSIVESMVASATSDELNVVGTFLTSVLASNFTKVNEGSVSEKIIFMGDSITSGGNSTIPEAQGFGVLFRIENSKNVNIYAYGNACLGSGFAGTSPLVTRTVNHIISMFANVTTTKKLLIALGTNDWGVTHSSAANFNTWYGNLLDAIHVADPIINIWCLSPILRTDGNENATLDDYRTDIGTLCAARSGYATHIVGKTILSAGDLGDGLHPTNAGQKKLKDAIYAIMYP